MKNQVIHRSDSTDLLQKIFKDSYDCTIEKEIPHLGLFNNKTKTTDAVISISYDKENTDSFYIEHETKTESHNGIFKKMLGYTTFLTKSYDQVILLQISCNGKNSRFDYSLVKEKEDIQEINCIIDILKRLNKKISEINKEITNAIEKNREEAKVKVKDEPDNRNNIFLLNDLHLIYNTLCNYEEGELEPEHLYYDFLSANSELLQELYSYEDVYEKYLQDDYRASTLIQKLDKVLKAKYDKYMINELDTLAENGVKEVKKSILNMAAYIPLKEEYFDVPEKNRYLLELKDNEYFYPSLKTTLWSNEFLIGTMDNIGDSILRMTKSMKDIKRFFSLVFFDDKEVNDFKYEPVSLKVLDVSIRKSLYSATCEIHGKKIGMMFFIPYLSLSDEMKINIIREHKNSVSHDYDEILFVELSKGDLLNLYDDGKVNRDFEDEFVITSSKIYNPNVPDYSWISDDINYRIESI